MRSLLILGVIFASLMAEAKVRVDYRISRMEGLVDFAAAISDEPHHSPGFKEVFEKSAYNTPEIKNSIEVLKGLRSSFYNGIEDRSGQTKYRQHGKNVSDLFVIQSIYSKDIAELSTRTMGLLPMADHLAYFRELKKIEPIYNKLIWNDLSPALKQHKAKIEALSKKAGLDEMFAKTEKFYNAQWPADTPFIVVLHPVPYIKGFKNSSNSHSLGNVETHGVIVKPGQADGDLTGSFGVIFHELCHSLYDAQSGSFKEEFEKYFLTNPSPYAMQAYTWFNEAAATALGNGWAFARANKNVLDKEEWYNNPTIDGYGKEIYPLVEEMLSKNQSIDENGVKKFVAAYEKRFPKAIFAYENLFNRLIVNHDSKVTDNQSIRQTLRKNIQISSLNIGGPIDHPQSLKDATEHDDDSLLFVFSDDTKKQIENAANSIPYIKANLKQIEAMKNRNIYSATGDNGRAYVFVKAQNQKDFDEAIAAITKKEYIDPQTKIWSY